MKTERFLHIKIDKICDVRNFGYKEFAIKSVADVVGSGRLRWFNWF